MKNVIIVAAGKGLRMGQDIPKQFIAVRNKPVLMRTIEAFYNYDNRMHIIVVLAADYREYWAKQIAKYNFEIAHKIVDGGETRFHSVKNGLDAIGGGLVAIHDAARPFVSLQLIDQCFKKANEYKAVIPVVDVTDSLRELKSEDESKIVDRTKFKLVQTPQVFESELLKKAYSATFINLFTDDASVVEYYGQKIHLIEGERTNIKITTPFDLRLAEILAEK